MIDKHAFKSNLTCLTQIFNYFIPILFNHVPPIFLELYSILFGASTSTRITILDNKKYVLKHNLHARGEVSKKGCLCYFRVKISFGCLHNLTPACIFLSLFLTMTSLIKKLLYNASSIIFRIAESSILFELTSKFFGNLYIFSFLPYLL